MHPSLRPLNVYPAVALFHSVTHEPLGLEEDNDIGAVYTLDADATPHSLLFSKRWGQLVGLNDLDNPSQLELLYVCAFDVDGDPLKVLVILETPFEGLPKLWAAPMGSTPPIAALKSAHWTLLSQSHAALDTELYAPFAIGIDQNAHILSASGTPIRAGDIALGDMILTRDNGGQFVRWMWKVSKTPASQLVRIPSGALHNSADLTLGATLRVMQYPDGLVSTAPYATLAQEPADTILFAFDRPEVIFAEGISIEALCVDEGMYHYIRAATDTSPPLHEL